MKVSYRCPKCGYVTKEIIQKQFVKQWRRSFCEKNDTYVRMQLVTKNRNQKESE